MTKAALVRSDGASNEWGFGEYERRREVSSSSQDSAVDLDTERGRGEEEQGRQSSHDNAIEVGEEQRSHKSSHDDVIEVKWTRRRV